MSIVIRRPLPAMAGRDRLRRLFHLGRDRMDWYAVAQREVQVVAAAEGWGAGRLADVLAIASPRVHVVRSVRTAYHWLATGRAFTCTLGVTVKCLDAYRDTGRVSGQKVTAFAAALQGDPGAIVLDVWMAKALRVPQESFDRPAVREVIGRRIRSLAERMGVEPRQAQAAIWAGALRDIGRTAGWLPVEQEYRNWVQHGRSYPASGRTPGRS